MIRLHQFAPALGLPNASPFCLKLETWLRMAGLPYIEDDDGTRVADSSFVIAHLKRRHGDKLDTLLTPRQRAEALAMQRLTEEDLYWAMVHWRWAEPAGWAITREGFFGTLPAPLRWVLPALARRGLLREMHGHGMGRHTPEQIHAIGCADLDAIADFLGTQPFMLGGEPTTLDATAYGFLADILWVPLASPLQRHARTHPTLEAYCQRMKARYWA